MSHSTATAATAAISLFSGCGGDTLGLERAGFKVVAFNEFKKAASDSHLANFPDSVALQGPKGAADITKVPDSVFEPYKGKIQLVFAGFPCQGFSKAGKKNAADPRNQMYNQFVRVVRLTEPHVFIGENVTGLLSMKSGPRKEDPLVIELIRKAFDEIGYSMTYQALEATDFGVPQSRKRLLIVGWRRATVPSFDPTSFWAAVSAWGAEKTLPKLRDFVTNSMEGAYKLSTAATPPNFATVALPVSEDAVPTGEPHPYVALKASAVDAEYQGKTYDRLLSCGKRDSPIHTEIVDLKKPSKTIICTYDHQPRLLVGLRKPSGDSYVRCLLPVELKQIQGFPSDYQVVGSLKEQVVQIGNAVPPALVEAVARQLVPFASAQSSSSAPLAPAEVPKPKRKIVRKPKAPLGAAVSETQE